jgi:uncharacterized membrane protein YphA (DoxX/SURF4 family)
MKTIETLFTGNKLSIGENIKIGGVWLLIALLVVLFLRGAARKLLGAEETVGHFEEWGYPYWLLITVGIFELVGAILLFIPTTTILGTLLLSTVMIGAIYTHIRFHHPIGKLMVSVICLAFLCLLAYIRWTKGK